MFCLNYHHTHTNKIPGRSSISNTEKILAHCLLNTYRSVIDSPVPISPIDGLPLQLYGTTRPGQYLTAYGNFSTFFKSFVTLFRMVTGENWNGIMHECALKPPFCTLGVDCGSHHAYLFFFMFQVTTSFLAVNLVVAVVIDHFAETEAESVSIELVDAACGVFDRDIAEFNTGASDHEFFASIYQDEIRAFVSEMYFPCLNDVD